MNHIQCVPTPAPLPKLTPLKVSSNTLDSLLPRGEGGLGKVSSRGARGLLGPMPGTGASEPCDRGRFFDFADV